MKPDRILNAPTLDDLVPHPGYRMTCNPAMGTHVNCEHDLHSTRNISVPGLRVGKHLTIQQRYEEWLTTADGQLVLLELERRAYRLLSAGWTHYSHKAIIETIRYDRNLAIGPSGGFKINDHYASRLARDVMERSPVLKGFFETRELKA